ncbi:MAG: hypothetical protein N2Z21_05790 [Candidatus Sumerlaeaceae bacterium]|nr:hypothetical protein [Candidatus Sumerlaeaceae bacterium]
MDDPFWLTDDIRPPFISDDFERASRLHELRGRVSEFLGNYQTSQSTPPTTPQASLWCVTFHADQAKGLTLFECRISTAAAAVSNDYSLFLAPTIGGKQTKKKFDTYFRVWRDPKKVTLSIKSTKRYSPLPAVYVTTTKIPLPQTPEALKRWQTTQNKLALRTFAYHSVVPTAFSRHLAYKIFATVPDLPEKRTSSPPSQVRDYIRRLAGDSGLKAGNLAVLRALSGQDLAHSVEAFDLFSGLYWPIRQQSPRAPQREDAWLVTKVYSKFPWVPSDNESTYISRYAAQLWRQVHGEAHFLPSLVRRFDRLMAAKGAEFEFSLLWLFAAVRRSLNLSSTSHPLLPGRWPSHAWSLLLEELRYLDSLKNNFVKKILMYPII